MAKWILGIATCPFGWSLAGARSEARLKRCVCRALDLDFTEDDGELWKSMLSQLSPSLAM